MKILLDSHVLLWLAFEQSRLSSIAIKAIEDQRNQVFVSMASLWEIAIKNNLGKLKLPSNFLAEICKNTEILQIMPLHIHALSELPFHHRDPFDRMLIAQAITEEMTLMTKDAVMHRYNVNIL